jgi:hypothetical protein
MLEQVFAGLALAVCVALLLHMAIGPARRARLDGWWSVRWRRRGFKDWRRLVQTPRRQAAARREAEAAIERARRAAERGQNDEHGESREGGEWDGNVYHPKSFDRRSGKRPPPH